MTSINVFCTILQSQVKTLASFSIFLDESNFTSVQIQNDSSTILFSQYNFFPWVFKLQITSWTLPENRHHERLMILAWKLMANKKIEIEIQSDKSGDVFFLSLSLYIWIVFALGTSKYPHHWVQLQPRNSHIFLLLIFSSDHSDNGKHS